MIKAVTLDFWDTIFRMDFEIDLNGVRIKKLEDVLKNYGINLPQDEIIKIYREVHKEFDRLWIEEYKTLTTSDVLNMIFSKIGISISNKDFMNLVDIFQEAILINPPLPMDGCKAAIEKLSKRYKLGIISDTGFSPGKVLRKILEKHDLLKYFSVLIFSDEFGKSKPHADTFLHAAKTLDCSISQMVHIGDNERTDVYGALNAGGKGILYTKGLDLPAQKTTPSAVMKEWANVEEIIEKL